MGKYSDECYDGKEKHLKQIANELAEANRLKRLEMQWNLPTPSSSEEGRARHKQRYEELEDKA